MLFVLFIYFQGKIKFSRSIWLIWLFWIFILFLLFHFLKWNRYFSACKNLPISSSHFWKHKSALLQILHQTLVPPNITSLYFFLSQKIIYFGQKEPLTVKIFETSECSGQNLSNFLCQFWNSKSIPLQILYYFSLSR